MCVQDLVMVLPLRSELVFTYKIWNKRCSKLRDIHRGRKVEKKTRTGNLNKHLLKWPFSDIWYLNCDNWNRNVLSSLQLFSERCAIHDEEVIAEKHRHRNPVTEMFCKENQIYIFDCWFVFLNTNQKSKVFSSIDFYFGKINSGRGVLRVGAFFIQSLSVKAKTTKTHSTLELVPSSNTRWQQQSIAAPCFLRAGWVSRHTRSEQQRATESSESPLFINRCVTPFPPLLCCCLGEVRARIKAPTVGETRCLGPPAAWAK